MTIDILNLTVEQAHKDLMEGRYTALDLFHACKKNIDEKNREVNAFLEVFSDAEDMAREADVMIKEGRGVMMTGIPVSLKDNILFTGHHASASSKMLEDYTAPFHGKAVEQLRSTGAVIMGRTNMDEFAMGSSTESSAYGITKNPLALDRVPGGSSGGAAASVAMGGCLVALGTDTAGSVRQPAGFCGVVGLKPSYGTISRSGIVAMGSSLDIIGVIGKTVACAEKAYQLISSHDPPDGTSVTEESKQSVSQKEIKTIGIPRAFVEMEGVTEEVKTRFFESIEKLKQAGYEVRDIELPHVKYSLATYYILMPAEVSTNLSRFDGVRFGLSVPGTSPDDSYMKTREAGFGREVKRRILLGTYVLSHGYYDAYYNKAVKVRHKITKEVEDTFSRVDVILTPTSPAPAFRFDEKQDPLLLYAADIFTVPANITDMPAISIPNGVNKEGLPLDIQIMAPYLQDSAMLSFAQKLEEILK
jgi:aspartyl-tRNA(Asn)/glutamyl-tRNA(Gln) amidotransferase subunit A